MMKDKVIQSFIPQIPDFSMDETLLDDLPESDASSNLDIAIWHKESKKLYQVLCGNRG